MKFVPAMTLLALAAVPAGATAQDHCTRETLSIRGTAVTAAFCAEVAPTAAGPELSLPVAETYSAPGGSISRTVTLRFIAGDGPSRVLENLDLTPLGLSGTLHLTLMYSGGVVRVE